ncbi:hypothetical protein PAECIP111893_02422 [Paenibacillus plantiphilus]|uniref:Putative exodeoxyribonuclease 8 PDDEXK-like domain-containing protein n=1 Tax=Paenibacillus plantiphilus TaxID=2905650 RepID=A0ABN8GI09_9BACL|nr:PD-(D/E)XK nuclease-like domain-containing protein [Paenibacillus plantiphilus]CAH1205799.1 hypothetical protein PAECIP111893_02422 [Paenibacillus plantiphilus]
MKLTADNYYSQEANLEYMSVSQFKDFDRCEAQAMAKLSGEYAEPKGDCFLIGSYVGAVIEGNGALERFISENPQAFSSRGPTKGELKSDYKHADKMVESLQSDPVCRQMLEGDKEVIITGELYGTLWKAKLDVHNPDEGRIVDLKTAEKLRKAYWMDGERVSFVENFRYTLQMAVYTELERIAYGRFDILEPLIVAVSKEDVPDKAVICFDEETMQTELMKVEAKLPRILLVKEGFEEPRRCEKCRYCRQTKQVTGLIHYLDLLEA